MKRHFFFCFVFFCSRTWRILPFRFPFVARHFSFLISKPPCLKSVILRATSWPVLKLVYMKPQHGLIPDSLFSLHSHQVDVRLPTFRRVSYVKDLISNSTSPPLLALWRASPLRPPLLTHYRPNALYKHWEDLDRRLRMRLVSPSPIATFRRETLAHNFKCIRFPGFQSSPGLHMIQLATQPPEVVNPDCSLFQASLPDVNFSPPFRHEASPPFTFSPLNLPT